MKTLFAIHTGLVIGARNGVSLSQQAIAFNGAVLHASPFQRELDLEGAGGEESGIGCLCHFKLRTRTGVLRIEHPRPALFNDVEWLGRSDKMNDTGTADGNVKTLVTHRGGDAVRSLPILDRRQGWNFPKLSSCRNRSPEGTADRKDGNPTIPPLDGSCPGVMERLV